MITLRMAFVFLIALLRGIKGESKLHSTGITDLGKSINLQQSNLLGDFQEAQEDIFVFLPSTCFKMERINYSGATFEYYNNTKAFYSKVAVEEGLDVSLQSSYALGVTLGNLIWKRKSRKSQVQGLSLVIKALTLKILVKKDCLDGNEIFLLNRHFVQSLERLPVSIKRPWLASSWKEYEDLLKTFGSHVITSIKRGSSIRQTTFAEASASYSERDFEVKSCLRLAGPNDIGKLCIDACTNISEEEIINANLMETSDTLIVRGGKNKTRKALLKKRTQTLIDEFLNEADETDQPLDHTFRSVWGILQSHFKAGSDNYIRAVNLQYYYLGYVNYDCPFITSGGVPLQMFHYNTRSTEQSPDFACSLAAAGCHTNKDCHFRPGRCVCRGKSCISHRFIAQDTGISRLIAYINSNEDWGWHGCGWKPGMAGFDCICANGNTATRREVWRMPSRDASVKGENLCSYHDLEKLDLQSGDDHR